MVALVAAASLILVGPAARAHTELVDSSPQAGQRLTATPDTIELVFNERVEADLATVVLVPGEADDMTLGVIEGSDPTSLISRLPERPAMPPGRWTVSYRVTSSDGHPISGSFEFIVLAAEDEARGRGSAGAPDEAPVPALDGDDRDKAPTVSPWLYAVLAVVLAAMILTLAALSRSSRRPQSHVTASEGDEAGR